MKQTNLKYLRPAVLFAAFWLMVCTLNANASGQVYHWYCKRVSDHKQPTADAPMQFITEYDGFYIDPRHGDDVQDKVVYLTFDAGYENGNVAKVLDVLRKEQVSGAFFCTGASDQ